MSDIYQLNYLPTQTTINLLASYNSEFNTVNFNYRRLLEKLQNVILHNDFIDEEDEQYKKENMAWMSQRGYDYIAKPSLFYNAPLTYLCIFLSEIFKRNQLNTIEKKVSPNVFKAITRRLNDFK